MKKQSEGFWCILAPLIVLATHFSFAGVVTYSGTGSGCLSGGSLTWNSDTAGTISGSFTRGGGNYFSDYVVIYIDSVAGGISTTANLRDTSSDFARTVTQFNGGDSKSTLNFAAGFGADYAIALKAGTGGGMLYQLPTQGSTLPEPVPVTLDNAVVWNSQNSGPYKFSVTPQQIGLNSSGPVTFGFETAYIVHTGSPNFESLESITGAGGWRNTITYQNYHLFPQLEPVPEPTNIALAAFGIIAVTAGVLRRMLRGSQNSVAH